MEEKAVKWQYEVAFKIDAPVLREPQGYTGSEAATRLGIPKANPTRWLRQYRPGKRLPGHIYRHKYRYQPAFRAKEIERVMRSQAAKRAFLRATRRRGRLLSSPVYRSQWL